MVTSRCIKCDNTTFEMKEAKISGSAFRMMFVQCSKCGGVIGVTEFTNTAATLHNITKKLGI